MGNLAWGAGRRVGLAAGRKQGMVAGLTVSVALFGAGWSSLRVLNRVERKRGAQGADEASGSGEVGTGAES